MAQEFIIRKGFKSLGPAQITGSLQLSGSLTLAEGSTINASFDNSTSTAISGAFTSVSESMASRFDSNESSISSLNQASSSYLLNTTDTLDGNLTVTGIVTAQEFHTEYISSSIVYQSGSTKFGDTSDDVHQFTGSVSLLGNGMRIDRNTSGEPYLFFAKDGVNRGSIYGVTGGGLRIFDNNDSQILTITGSNVGISESQPSFKLQVAGTFRASGDSSFGSNVGIGTTSPESKLAVKGSSGDADLFSISDITVPTSGTEYGVGMIKTNSTEYALNITSYNANGKGVRIYNNGGQNAFLVSQAGGDRFVIDGSGNTGIGTTSPSEKLQVIGNVYISGVSNSIYFDTDSDGKSIRQYVANLYDFNILNGRGSSSKFVLGSSIISLGTSSTPHFYINLSTGNTGIGTTSPGQKLHVAGSIRMDQDQALRAGSSDNWIIGQDSSTNLIHLGSTAVANDIAFDSSTGRVFMVKAGGNVGIGTTSPSVKLHVRESGLFTNQGTDSGQSYVPSQPILTITTDGNGTASSNYATNAVFKVGIGGGDTGNVTTEWFRVNLNGNVGIGQTSPQAPLDIKGAASTVNYSSLLLRSGNTSNNFDSSQIQLSYNNTANFSHAIKTRHHDGNYINAIDFYVWKYGTDANTAVGTQHVMTAIQGGDNVADTGRVGVGTQYPDRKLSVEGSVRIGRSTYNWYQAGTNDWDGSQYLHLKTNLDSGASGNVDHTMSLFSGKLYSYSSAYIREGSMGFHNWSGTMYNLVTTGNFWQGAYSSSDGKVVLVVALGGGTYFGINIDWHQSYPYTLRSSYVTSVSASSNTSGVY